MPLQINIDALELVSSLTHTTNNAIHFFTDCRYLLDKLNDPEVNHVYKEQNKVADQLPPRPSSSGKRWRICGLSRRFKPHTMQSEAWYLSGEG
ncbi:hypothetical protein RDI58_019849 [Solanum bulbocastanum]|uniref:RNase H type-1 domain-containing protein n=1 Tax=Solanum bulbocastanum TaxID=147425 RepID=A0AAN8YA31_SOLBU